MAHVAIYTTPSCPYCVMAKRLMREKGVSFDEIDVATDTDKRRWLVETTGQRTGLLVEVAPTEKLFTNPGDQRTEDYIAGRFG